MSACMPVTCYSTEPPGQWHRRQTRIQMGILQGIREMGSVGPEAKWKVVVG